MTDIFGRRDGQPVNWFHRDKARSNQFCVYCGGFVGPGSDLESNKEHLIARNFVPKGTLGSQGFNFIFRSCCICNERKADAERHVSTVTMFNSPARRDDRVVNEAAINKGSKDYHPDKRGVLVRDSFDDHTVEFGGGGFQIKFGMVSPPQLNPRAVHQLAFCHVSGLFGLTHTKDPREQEKTRILPVEQLVVFGFYGHQDWGNPQLMEISRQVLEWQCVANVDAAHGYFRALVKRSMNGEDGYFWALEWNKYLRVVGAIAFPKTVPKIFSVLPDLKWKVLPGENRFRPETPIDPEDDNLFSCPGP